jgi:hypothetical protein
VEGDGFGVSVFITWRDVYGALIDDGSGNLSMRREDGLKITKHILSIRDRSDASSYILSRHAKILRRITVAFKMTHPQ